MTHRLLCAGLLVAAAVAVGCSSRLDDGADNNESNLAREGEVDDLAELESILGDDKVAAAFRTNPSGISSRLPPMEQFLRVGRACNRRDSREIFIVEEKNTRLGGVQEETPDLLPRAVISGCSQNPSSTAGVRESFELFVAVVSDKTYPLDDPFSLEPVEVMALDQTTGLYNFYILHPAETPGQHPTVQRFDRRADGEVVKMEKIAGQKATTAVNQNRECFNCHVHGGPVMNELTLPWTGWVSSHRLFSRSLTGTTRELVSEARPFAAEHTRASLANDLERTIRASTSMWVEGIPGRPGSGLGPQTMSGQQPGGIAGLLRSVFCETEFNFASSFDTIPFPLFLDETVANFARLERPLSLPATAFELLPVRSETDKRIEIFLQKRQILRPNTVLASRIVDDEHDVFSAKRCALHDTVTASLEEGGTPEIATRQALLAAVEGDDAHPARTAFIRALLDTSLDEDSLYAAEDAYVSELQARYQLDIAKLETTAGLREIQRRLWDRQIAAQAMFPSPANPLPLMHPVAAVANN